MRTTILSLFVLICAQSISAQMINGTDTLYGNEWIDYDKNYFEIKLAEDGVYRISYDELQDMGFPLNQTSGANIQMFYMGEEHPLYISSSGSLSNSDYIEFVGSKNRGQLDHHLYINGKQDQLNPEYSLFNDTSTYFITYDNAIQGLRFEQHGQGGNLTPESYYIHEELNLFNNFPFKPNYTNGGNVRYSHFDVGEGYGSTTSDNFITNIATPNIAAAGPATSELIVRLASNTKYIHELEIVFNDDIKVQENWNNARSNEYLIPVQNSDLNSSNSLEVLGKASLPMSLDGYSVAYTKLRYPRTTETNEDNFEVYLPAHTTDKYYEFEVPSTSDEYYVFDMTNGHRLLSNADNGVLKFTVAPSTDARKVRIYKATDNKSIASARTRSFIDYSEVDPSYLILTSKRLHDADGSNDIVAQYADYRATEKGGDYSTYIVLMEDVIDQFGYGIDRHNIANRNFAHYVKKEWENLEYWFNIGKGIEYQFSRTEASFLETYDKNHVQTFGAPGSDLTMLSSNGEANTKFKFGRLAATNTDEVELYYRKIVAHDDLEQWEQTYEGRDWMKHILHLSGGDVNIQNLIFNYLEEMRDTIENNKFGANVTTYRKTTTTTIEPADIDDILQRINEGLSLITFFGHSGVGTFDFNLEDPEKWDNENKYPMIISLGCLSGNVFTKSRGISEKFILEPDKGAVAFLAASGTAFIPAQGNAGRDFYDLIGGDYYGKTIGETIQKVLADRKDNTTLDVRSLMQQFILHGDPAIRLNPQEGKDYTFDFSSLSTDPHIVDSNLDSFKLNFDVVNIGQYEADSMDINVQHVTESGELNFEKTIRTETPKYRSTHTVNIPIKEINIIGKNTIKATLDINNEIIETPSPDAETNNVLVSSIGEEGFCFYSTDNSLNPVCPVQYGIWTDPEVTLYASTLNSFKSTENKYLFEIDTTKNFNSSFKTRHEITSKGGMLSWKPDITFDPGETYYWRTSPDSTSTLIGYNWKDQSFVYLPNSEFGWNHNHFQQFQDDDLDGYDFSLDQEMIFDTSSRSVELINGLWDVNTKGIRVGGGDFAASLRPWQAIPSGVAIGAYHPSTGKAMVNGNGISPYGGDFGSATGGFGVHRSFAYAADTENSRADIINFLENEIPDGYYVIFWTFMRSPSNNIFSDEWAQDSINLGTNIFQVLEAQGATKSRGLETSGTVPYNFMYRKGVNAIDEEIASSVNDEINTILFISRLGIEGSLTTVPIGPAKSWDRVEWNSTNVELNDISNFYIEAYNQQSELDSIYSYPNTSDGIIDLSFLDASLYPTVKLRYESFDDTDRTTPELEYLRVFYEGYPDIALDPLSNLIFNRDTLQQGEDLYIRYAITNVSAFDLEDSIAIEYILTDAQNQQLVFNEIHAPLNAGQSLPIIFSQPTVNMIGDYTIAINLKLPEGVKEKISFNNFGLRSFTVESDKKNPLLDVTFDGYHILDGDVVSPEPLISICLEDDNPFLLLIEEGSIELILTHPNGDIEYFEEEDPRLQFFPATNAEDNKARLEFTPLLQNDGEYKLKIQGWDASGNASGNNDYERRFQVITKEAVSNVLNYPNPFSTSTQFVFTLTGNIPDFMNIEIRTMSGKVVKEIQKEELGLLRVGINRTDYKWNGTDEFGQKLANGVYLYRVVTKNAAGETYEAYENGTDTFFTKGYGKMVIMR